MSERITMFSNRIKTGLKLTFSVPFDQKEKAKQNGMRWDPVAKKWYLMYNFMGVSSFFDEHECDKVMENITEVLWMKLKALEIDLQTTKAKLHKYKLKYKKEMMEAFAKWREMLEIPLHTYEP